MTARASQLSGGGASTLSAWRQPHVHLAALLCVAVLVGGGGVAYGFMNLAVQLVALALLAMHWVSLVEFWTSAPPNMRWLIVATIAVPLLQLVPLPPAMWQSLPGRELAIEARIAAGDANWHPYSLAPHRTLVAAVGLIGPLAAIVIGWSVSASRGGLLIWLAVGLGLAQFGIGALQVTSQGQAGLLFPENPMPGVLFGTFANRNSTGLFLVTCLCLMLGFDWKRFSASHRAIALAAAVLILVAIFLTQSRSAIALTAIPLGLAACRWIATAKAPRKLLIGGMAAVVVAALLAGLAPQTRLSSAIERFAQTEDARAHIWPDAIYSAQRYWPAGAGMGAFDEVFQADESLEHIGYLRAGRAHNDYVEVAIEAGLPGVALVLAWLSCIGWWSWRARHSPARWAAWAGTSVLVVIALQSILDYALRTQAMLVVAAFALVVLVHGTQEERE